MRLTQRIDDTNKQIEFLRNDVANLRNDVTHSKDSINQTLFMFFFAIVAIIIWDRRSVLKPFWEKINEENNTISNN